MNQEYFKVLGAKVLISKLLFFNISMKINIEARLVKILKINIEAKH